MRLVLASNSPRRKELLKKEGLDFVVASSDFCENNTNGTSEQIAKYNAEGKAKAVYKSLGDKTAIVLGADTVVDLCGTILGKPKNQAHAVEMLKNLSGKTHSVITGYSIIGKGIAITSCVKTEVKFNLLSEELIKKYVATGSPLDKAGAYGIQDGYPLVESYNGSFNNIVGLPTEELCPIIKNLLKK